MHIICLGCHSIPRTISSNDVTEGCVVEQGPRPRPFVGGEVQRNSPVKLVRGPPKKLKGKQSGIVVVPPSGVIVKDRNLKRNDLKKETCKPRLMRSSGMRRDWSLVDLSEIMNTS